jgi:hypothetical protein
MSDKAPPTENGLVESSAETGEQEGEVLPPSPPSRFRWFARGGCALLTVVWFLILLLPCFFIVLASQQQITISQGGLPDQQIRIWLIMESAQRGLGFSSTATYPVKEAGLPTDGVCLQTNVSYILWQGQGEASQYCECYSGSGDNWTPIKSYSSECPR